MCIPLYQQHRNFADIYEGIIDSGEPSYFEYESFANALGEDVFSPEDAATSCILKTRVVDRKGPASQLSVTAHSFRGEPRVTHVSKYGGDGRWHDVPVHWTEYLPVTCSTPLAVCETDTDNPQEFESRCNQTKWQMFFRQWNGLDSGQILFRRGLAAFLLDPES